MSTNLISNMFLSVDNYCDYIPGASTVTSLVDIFEKCVIVPFINKETRENSPYLTHIHEKSLVRSLVLLIPGLGNFIVGIYDLAQRNEDYDNPNHVLEAVQTHGAFQIYHASERLKNDKKFMLKVVALDGEALAHGRRWFWEDEDVLLGAIENYPRAINLSKILVNDSGFLAKVDSVNKHQFVQNNRNKIYE